ncbi:hypothetical protein TNCV_1453211 [Trichonephila clavipes]|nr:hypothetical protein TNCV_1453211 [Trichonephila clavipes]
MRPGIVFLKYHVGGTLQQGQSNRFHNLCDAVVLCQTAFNVFQRCPVIKHYATPNHDARFKTDLTLGEMGWFVEFSGSSSYPPTAVIPPHTETKFIREQ